MAPTQASTDFTLATGCVDQPWPPPSTKINTIILQQRVLEPHPGAPYGDAVVRGFQTIDSGPTQPVSSPESHFVVLDRDICPLDRAGINSKPVSNC